MKPWKLAIIVGVLAAIGLLAAVAIASGADRDLAIADRGVDCDGSRNATVAGDGAGAGGRGFGASAEMRAWYEEYGADPESAEAQTALDALRTQHQTENRASGESGYGRGLGNGTGDEFECGGDDAECGGTECGGAGRGVGGGNGW